MQRNWPNYTDMWTEDFAEHLITYFDSEINFRDTLFLKNYAFSSKFKWKIIRIRLEQRMRSITSHTLALLSLYCDYFWESLRIKWYFSSEIWVLILFTNWMVMPLTCFPWRDLYNTLVIKNIPDSYLFRSWQLQFPLLYFLIA